MANRIHVKGDYRYTEKNAGAASIQPGMMLMENSSGNVVVHDTEGGRGEAMFGMEDALQGNVVSTAYTSGEPVPIIIPAKGSEINALLKTGYDYVKGEALISAGDGCLMPESDADSTTTVQQVIAHADEDVDLTDSGDVNTLGKVRIV